MASSTYINQVRLLIGVIPFVSAETVFALKGGSAINLFHHDLPRLSVDIDLIYLPVADRDASLEDIDGSLDRIAGAINAGGRFYARRIAGGGEMGTRIQVRHGSTEIKIETSPVVRGTVLPVRSMRVSGSVEEEYGFAEARIVSFEDLFGGKLCAALDRQHPRDLFDVKLLYETAGLTDDLFRVFLVYAASSGRPLHELLNPNFADITKVFAREFAGMSTQPVEVEELTAVRSRLVDDLRSRLSGSAAEFLRSLQAGDPRFDLFGFQDAAQLPAVRWKVRNLQKLREEDPKKHREQTAALEALLA